MMRSIHVILSMIALLVITSCAMVKLPDYDLSKEVVWLEQGWDEKDREFFHHASQGSAAYPIPYQWLMALEQPILSLGEAEPIFSDDYLRRLGFITSKQIPETNPDGLPIGFTLERNFPDQTTGQQIDGLGFTCAACHTGRMTYRGTELRYDGGPAMIELKKLTESIGFSMFMTRYLPGRFDRFAKRVLGSDYSKQQKENLSSNFDIRLAVLKKLLKLDKSVANKDVYEGFGRLDALTQIGNKVFAINLDRPENYEGLTAPVDFPYLWLVSWLDWVQYDGSIQQPMVRNAGESLGLGAAIKMNVGPDHFQSSVHFENLLLMEELLAGKTPPRPSRKFSGLQPPAWPEEYLGSIDRTLANDGKALYVKHCQACHFPPTDSEEFWADDKHWNTIDGIDFLKIKPLFVRTDPGQAEILGRRTLDTRGAGLDVSVCYFQKVDGKREKVRSDIQVTDGPETPYPLALAAIVEEAVHYWYEDQGISKERQIVYDGNRPNCVQKMETNKPKYHAIPLDGIWATAPFLHNGSVPTLYDLLLPLEERPTEFYLGNPEYDVDKLGFHTEPFKGGSKLDTTKRGNSNSGHQFPARGMEESDRLALLEYLKTL